jgi:hypothetical protein
MSYLTDNSMDHLLYLTKQYLTPCQSQQLSKMRHTLSHSQLNYTWRTKAATADLHHHCKMHVKSDDHTFSSKNWVVAKIGPDGMDCEIWTRSGPNLDTIWTGFIKTGAKIPGKILCPRTRELILASALSEKFKFCPYPDCVRTREGGT